MKWRHPGWAALGIEPTDDTRAIRTAYAQKLKAIDPDRDPAAFIALREAFEAVRVQAQWVNLPDEEEEEAEEVDWEVDDAAPDPLDAPGTTTSTPDVPDQRTTAWDTTPEVHEQAAPRPDTTPDERASPWQPNPAAVDAHARDLATLLHSAEGRRATPQQEREMLAHWDAILADPRMHQVSRFNDVDQWLSTLLGRTLPTSDPLVIPATEHFGWTALDGTIKQGPLVAALSKRYRTLKYARDLRLPSHPHHEAWIELTTPANERSRRGRVKIRKVHSLVSTLRRSYPGLEDYLDPERLTLWNVGSGITETRPADRVQLGRAPKRLPTYRQPKPLTRKQSLLAVLIGMLVYGALFGLASLGKLSDPGASNGNQSAFAPVYDEPLQSPIPDIDRALEARFGDALDLATIEDRNPALARRLNQVWEDDHRAGTSVQGFRLEVEALADSWYSNGLSNGGVALLRDYHRLSLDMAKALRASSPAACSKFLGGSRRWNGALKLDPGLRKRETALMARTLLETNGEPHTQRTAMVPGEVIVGAARRAHVPEQTIRDWLDRKPVANQCDVTIAVTETVMAQSPKISLPIMRVL